MMRRTLLTSALDMPEIMSYIYSKSWKLQFSASSSIIIIEDYYLQTFLHSLFPSMQCFFYICDYLQISPAAFFDDTTKAPHALDTLTELLKTLSVEQLELIAQIAREFSEK